ncbi:PEGA domain-containing protein [Chondromyces apiculatus]|nr:PEGA domain-containing protein [Chondromyces apiculatus]
MAAAMAAAGLSATIAGAQPSPGAATTKAQAAPSQPTPPQATRAAGAQATPPAGAAAKPQAGGAPAGSASTTTPGGPTPQAPLSESLTGMAKAEYGAGNALLKDGDFAGALVQFEKAYALSKDHRVLWNIALCQKNLRRYAALLDTLQRLEKDGGALLTAEDRKDIADLRTTAEGLVSRVEVVANEAGATVLIDDASMGTTPLAAPLVVELGERRIRVTKPGFKEFTRTLRVEGGGRISLAATLTREVRRGTLVVQAGAEDLISLDGRTVGRGRWEGSVPSGQHALRVSAPGKETHEAEVLVRDGEMRRVDVGLNAAASSSGRTWLWIGGGAALLAGAVITGALLFEPGTPAERGTLGTFPLSFGGR